MVEIVATAADDLDLSGHSSTFRFTVYKTVK